LLSRYELVFDLIQSLDAYPTSFARRGVLAACKRNNSEALSSIPIAKLNSGSSEIRNWITMAGATAHLKSDWQEYIPCYRSAAGTGCGMGFAVWK
jgi:hypothetical protein